MCLVPRRNLGVLAPIHPMNMKVHIYMENVQCRFVKILSDFGKGLYNRCQMFETCMRCRNLACSSGSHCYSGQITRETRVANPGCPASSLYYTISLRFYIQASIEKFTVLGVHVSSYSLNAGVCLYFSIHRCSSGR